MSFPVLLGGDYGRTYAAALKILGGDGSPGATTPTDAQRLYDAYYDDIKDRAQAGLINVRSADAAVKEAVSADVIAADYPIPQDYFEPSTNPAHYFGASIKPRRSWVFWGLVSVLILTAIAVVVWVVVLASRKSPSPPPPPPPVPTTLMQYACCSNDVTKPCAFSGACGDGECVQHTCDVPLPPAAAAADWSGVWTGGDGNRTLSSLVVTDGSGVKDGSAVTYEGFGVCAGGDCAWGPATVSAASGDSLFLAWPQAAVTLVQTGKTTAVGDGDTLTRNVTP